MKMVLQHFDGDFCSTISKAPSKRRKNLRHKGHKVHNSEYWPCKSGGGGSYKWACKTSIYINWYEDKSQYICKYIIRKLVIFMPYLDSVTGNDVCISLPSTISIVLDAQRNLSGHRCSLKKKRPVLAPTKRVEEPSKTTSVLGSWDSLPYELQDNILQRGEFEDLFLFKIVSKSWKEFIESEAFSKSRQATSSREGSFTAINYYIKDRVWQCTGFDLHSKTWRTLPPFSPTPAALDAERFKENSAYSPKLPAPDAELFKEYSVCGHGGLMCADVSKLPHKGKLVVFNPLTRKTFALPPLLYPRSPVLVHMSVDPKTKSYKVIVAGSSTASDEHLSKKMEVFDSKIAKWEEASDLPGPAFGLNEHQTGVCVDGVLYFISFLEGNSCRGVVAFDVQNGKWLDSMACPIPFSMYSNTLQLVENDGKVYLFTEQERAGSVEHCIDVLEISSPNAGAVEKCHWRNVVRVKKSGGRGLQVYPENTCVSFGEGQLCVFNTLTRDGVVYDMQDGRQVELLQPPPPEHKGDNFFSLNPASFTLQPSFDSDPIPWSDDAI